MRLGLMRNFTNPIDIAFSAAKIRQNYGIDIIYVTPKDIDMENCIENL